MCFKKKISFLSLLLIPAFLTNFNTKADNHDVYEVLSLIQKDLKTLEKAVYSQTNNSSNNNSDVSITSEFSSEDVLTRHLLKLSEIENQFQELTNKFEEVNFKLDKISRFRKINFW